VSRIATMAEKYRAGRLLPVEGPGRLANVAAATLVEYTQSMDVFALESGVAAVFRLIDATNEYIASTEPWALARDPANDTRLSQVLFDVAEAVRIAGVLLLPIVPGSAAEILHRVGESRPSSHLRIEDATWTFGDRNIRKGPSLWPRLETDTRSTTTRVKGDRSIDVEQPKDTAAPVPALNRGQDPSQATAGPGAAAGHEQITLDDFMKIDLRVAKVVAAEKVPNSRKLVKLEVDVGTEQRTLVAGIAEAYVPEELVGRTIVMVVNLQPAKLMGIESNGMVLAASPEGGKPVLVTFDRETAPGTRVR